jgi:hypothetical protein
VAGHVFLVVQHRLLAGGDVAAVLAGHVTLFLADLMVLSVQLRCLSAGDLAGGALFMDARAILYFPYPMPANGLTFLT